MRHVISILKRPALPLFNGQQDLPADDISPLLRLALPAPTDPVFLDVAPRPPLAPELLSVPVTVVGSYAWWMETLSVGLG